MNHIQARRTILSCFQCPPFPCPLCSASSMVPGNPPENPATDSRRQGSCCHGAGGRGRWSHRESLFCFIWIHSVCSPRTLSLCTAPPASWTYQPRRKLLLTRIRRQLGLPALGQLSLLPLWTQAALLSRLPTLLSARWCACA